MRKVIATALGALLLVGSLSAVAIAQEADTDVADVTDVTERVSVLDQSLSELVTEGVITQAQADTISERVGTLHSTFRGRQFRHLEIVAEVLNMDAADIQTALEEGSTLAEIAGDQTDALIEALVAEHQAKIDQAVADGRIDADQAAEMAANTVERVTARVNGEEPAGGPGFGRGGHRHGGFGGGFGPGPDAADDASSTSTST